MNTALEGVRGSASRPGRYLLPPPGKTRYPLYMRLGGPQGRSGQVRKISPPPGFDPRTVQPVASCYTNYANRLYYSCMRFLKLHLHELWHLVVYYTGMYVSGDVTASFCPKEEGNKLLLYAGVHKSVHTTSLLRIK